MGLFLYDVVHMDQNIRQASSVPFPELGLCSDTFYHRSYSAHKVSFDEDVIVYHLALRLQSRLEYLLNLHVKHIVPFELLHQLQKQPKNIVIAQ